MSLLDRVINWSVNSISCSTTSHRKPTNPLMSDGKLPSLCLIEYGAQAAAVHAALISTRVDEKGKPAYIGNLKNIEWFEEFVNPTYDEITVHATREASSSAGAIYHLEVMANELLLLSASMTLLMRG